MFVITKRSLRSRAVPHAACAKSASASTNGTVETCAGTTEVAPSRRTAAALSSSGTV